MPLMIKTLSKLEIWRNFLNLIKNILEKLTANIVFHGERLKGFTLRSRTWQGSVFSPLPYDIPGVLVREVGQ